MHEAIKSDVPDLLYPFQWKLSHKIICVACGNESETISTYRELSLPFPVSPADAAGKARPHLDLARLMQSYFADERVEYTCEAPGCGHREAVKRVEVLETPHVILLHLNRFMLTSLVGGEYVKRRDYVDIPDCFMVCGPGDECVAQAPTSMDGQPAKDAAESRRDDGAGQQETSTGDKETSTGDREASTGEKETSTGDKETSTGDRETSTGEKEIEESESNQMAWAIRESLREDTDMQRAINASRQEAQDGADALLLEAYSDDQDTGMSMSLARLLPVCVLRVQAGARSGAWTRPTTL